jgi:hypothetical protein
MKAKFIALALMTAPLAQSFACQACFGDYRGVAGGPPKNIQHMAVAVWVMMFFIMSVVGGVGAFTLHLWRRSRMPIEPHQQLAEEDLSQYA